jgi:hypothetical protein
VSSSNSQDEEIQAPLLQPSRESQEHEELFITSLSTSSELASARRALSAAWISYLIGAIAIAGVGLADNSKQLVVWLILYACSYGATPALVAYLTTAVGRELTGT